MPPPPRADVKLFALLLCARALGAEDLEQHQLYEPLRLAVAQRRELRHRAGV